MCEDLALYALNGLEGRDRDRFEVHLATCDRCKDELPSLFNASASLALLVPPVQPPARLKMRVMGIPSMEETSKMTALDERRKQRKIKWAGVALSGLAASFLLGVTLAPSLFNEEKSTSPISIPQSVTVLQSIQAAPDASTVTRKMGSGSMRIDFSRELDRGVFSSTGLPSLTGEEVYQLWIKDGSGSMHPAGSFQTSDSMALIEGDVTGAVAVGVTREPNGEQKVPTSTPLAMMTL